MKRLTGALVALVLILSVLPALGQQQVDTDEKRRIDTEMWKRLAPPALVASSSPEYMAAQAKAALQAIAVHSEWEQIHLDYERKRLAQRAATFAWQHTSTQLIFGLVTVVVLAGLGLSFWHVLRGESSPSKLVIGDKGIELSSRLVGVIVFVLSLAFFYLYLDNVYPISEVASVQSTHAAPTVQIATEE